VAIIMTDTTVHAQGSIRGFVPVLAPKSGSGVDGDAYAHMPAGYEAVGDLFDAQHPDINGHGVINPFTGELLYPGQSFFLQDRYENDLTIFTASNKINDNPNTYTWGPGNSPNKNEIQNAGAHFSYGDPSLPGGVATDLWCLFAGDRQVTSGSSYIDFEFLQKSMTITGATMAANGSVTGGSGGFTSLGTDGGRTLGDILITIEFTNGGGDANAVIRVWSAKAGGGFEYVIHPNSEFLGKIFITNNTVMTHVPFDVYGSDPNGTGVGGDYAPNQWAEGAINLTQVFKNTLALKDPCFSVSTLFIRTRSSGNSQQSELKDFPGAPIQFTVDGRPKGTAVATNPSCNGGFGSVDLSVTGGSSIYTYSWTGPNNFTASTQDISNALAGTYQWTVTDSKGCIASGSVDVTQPPAIVVSNATLLSPKCNGGTDGSITITSSGGTGILMYSANDGETYQASNVFSGLAAGEYKWAVKDANNCILKGTVTITQPTAIAVSAALLSPKCNGGTDGSITITASGGTGILMYSANDGETYQASNVFSGLAAGEYKWAVKDANNCVLKGTVTITQPTAIAASAVANNPSCFGVANTGFTITASGGTGILMYSSDNGATYVASGVFTGLTAGTYSWKVKDANGCMKSGTVTITIPPMIAANVTPVNPKCCYEPDGSITISATGGTGTLMYSINDGSSYQTSNVFSGLLAGTYKWVVKDANNCILKGSVTLTNPPLLVASSTLVNPKCHEGTDGSITIIASGGTGTLMYSIDQGVTYQASNVFNGLAAGEYKWRVKDANNCLLKGTFILTTPPAVIVTANLVSPKCHGGNDGSITINAAGGSSPFMYSINDGATYQSSNVFNALVAGQYKWAVKENNGCISRGMVNLVNPALIVASATPTNPRCNGGADGSFAITATGGTGVLMYSADNGLNYQSSNVFTALMAGEYKWMVKDANGCIMQGTVNLGNPKLISVSVAAVNPSCCEALRDGSITLNASGGTGAFMYSINGGSTYQTSNFFGNLSAGVYNWMVKDVNNCVTSGTVTLRNPSDPLAKPAATTVKANFTAYPVPFKDVLTIKYDFDYISDVKIEMFDAQGKVVLTKLDTNSYLNKEITLRPSSNIEQEKVYIVKVTTDRGYTTRKVMSGK